MSRSFADVLDDALGMTPEPAVVSRGLAAVTYQPPNPFLFTRAIGDDALPERKPGAVVASGFGRTSTPSPEAKLDPVLENVRPLAAALGSNFTAQDLRREYRRLARRIHPDRHPFATASERAALSRQFADLTREYQALFSSAVVGRVT